ncbi:PQQ-binding-like beta-propeller repeat protein [Streptomyces sp. NPDC048581]|uniref:protein kinase domain-containing protein n=1 Tax=unclassified Streptomyces TaxID=2593676 RepID=UPI00372206B7
MPLRKDDPKSVGGYKLLDRLGAGGMGAVYRGRSRSGREVAVKVVHAQYAEDPVFRARFRQEIEAVRKVSGVFTAPVVDADPEAERPWMATQYVAGRSLADRIRDRGALRDGELRQLALGLVEALRDIHRAGVVHRDLKPANVLMAEDGPRVIDFGISRAAANHNTLTETGQMIGTPPFMSPEQLTDARTVGPASDIFSLGALLVYATTGRGPFDTDSPYLTAYRVVHYEPVLDGIGQPLRGILERCLSKEAAERPGLEELAGEFADALPEADPGDMPTVTLRGDHPVVARTRPDVVADPASTTWSGRRRRRIRPLLAVTGTVGALALGLLGYIRFGPGFADSPQEGSTAPAATTRFRTLPGDWEPWQTTLSETAPLGAKKALGTDDGSVAGEPTCLMNGNGVYCAGEGILPVRLDARTGKTLWRAEAPGGGDEIGSYNSALLGVRSGTVVLRQSVFNAARGTDVAEVLGIDAGTGEQLWTHRVNDENLDMAISAGLVITSGDNGTTVTARSPRTGAERWTAPMPKGHYCSFVNGGTDVYAQCIETSGTSETSMILVLDPADGSARTLKAPGQSGILGFLDGRLAMMQAPEEEGPSGEILPYDRVLLVDPDTGTRTTVKLAESFDGEPVLSAGTLWFVSPGGVVRAVSPRTGKLLWETRTSLEGPGAASYDAQTRTLYLASISGRVAALDGRKGTSLWETLPRTERSDSAPVGPGVLLYKGSVIVATSDGTVFALDPADPERKPASGGPVSG